MSLLKKKFGFSVIELIVVVAIIGILSTVSIVNYSSIGKKSAVSVAAQTMVSDIRKVQSYVLNGKTEGDNKGSWGVYFAIDNTTYTVFADKNQDKKWNGDGESYQVIDLPKNVKIKNIDPDTQLDLVYLPPDPEVYINQATTTASSVITLSNLDGSNEVRVVVNVFGLVDVE